MVICPCHGSEFDVRTGDVVTPPALEPLPIYEAREDGGTLFVRLAAPRGGGRRGSLVAVRRSAAAEPTVPGPSLDGLALDDVDLTDLDVWERGVPYDWLALLRRDAPLHWQPEDEGPGFWVITRYEDVVRVAKEWETFSSELGGTSLQDLTPEELAARRSMIDTDPPAHTRMRALVNKGFTPRVVNAYEERIRALARDILETAVERGELDWVESVAAELPDVGLLRDHGSPGRGSAADHRARRQAPREHRSRRSSARSTSPSARCATRSCACCRSRARSPST